MRKAFTMLELIFVIVIIGLLAAVSLVKMAANRDNANASLCANEIGELIHEIGNSYTSVGYVRFKDLTIEEISNISTGVVLNQNGILEGASTTVDTTGVTYYCGGDPVVGLVSHLQDREYNLTIENKNPTSPVGLNVERKLIKQNIIIKNGVRHYTL